MLIQGFSAIVARAPIFVPYPTSYTGPRDATIYASPAGIYQDPAYGPIGFQTPAQQEYAPFECGDRCYNR